MVQDHRCTPARGRYFPLPFAALLGRLDAFPRFSHRGRPRRLSLQLRNGRLETPYGHLLCVVWPTARLEVFSLPDHVGQVHGCRAMDYVLDRLRLIVSNSCSGTGSHALGSHYAYLGPLGRITITRHAARRRRRRTCRRYRYTIVMTRRWLECSEQEILVSTSLPRSRPLI